MSGTVLVAVDLAHAAEQTHILQEADRMATLHGGPLAVVTVIPDYGMSIVGTYFEEGAEAEMLEKARVALHEVVSGVLGADADKRIKHIIRHGNAYEEILVTAKELEVELIVMGAHKPNYSDYLIGPTSDRVVRHAECSVYVIRQ